MQEEAYLREAIKKSLEENSKMSSGASVASAPPASTQSLTQVDLLLDLSEPTP